VSKLKLKGGATAVPKSAAKIPGHVGWLVNTGKTFTTADGKVVELWEFRHKSDPLTITEWARHFRNHYCSDDEIDDLRSGTGLSRGDYLRKIVFPDPLVKPGPSIRAGDFAEIMVADYLEYLLNFWVPRTRYDSKAMRNISTAGSDVIGFFVKKDGTPSPQDTLAVYEVKAQFSGVKPLARLQDAVDGSMKDLVRKSESLNAIKRRLLNRKLVSDAKRVERFQNAADRPYRQTFGAAALYSKKLLDGTVICATTCVPHPYRKQLKLVVIAGDSLMKLVRELYEAAANDA
jgi:hypothetical protein